MAFFVPAPAAAQQRGWTPRTMGNRMGADINLWPTGSFVIFSVGFIGQLRLSPHAFFDFDFPWAYGVAPGPNNLALTLGNPTVGAHYATRLGGRASFYIGGTGSVPLHVDGDGPGDGGTAFYASLARALDDLHRFLPQYVFLRAPFGFELGLRPVFLRFELAPVFWIPLPDGADDPELVFEHATEIEILANSGVGGGLRLQAVFFSERRERPDRCHDGSGAARRRAVLRLRTGAEGLLRARRPADVATVRGTLGGKW